MIVKKTVNNPDLRNNKKHKSTMNSRIQLQDIAKIEKIEKKAKFNTTSSLYLDSSCNYPNQFRIIQGYSKIIYNNICNSELSQLSNNKLSMFDETVYIIENISCISQLLPTYKDVYDFTNSIFKITYLSIQCLIQSLIYIQRLLILTDSNLSKFNWKPILFISFIISQKIIEETPMSNDQFINVYSFFNKYQLHKLELLFLKLIKYHLSVDFKTYFQYYLQLCALNFENKNSEFSLRMNSKIITTMWVFRSKGIEDYVENLSINLKEKEKEREINHKQKESSNVEKISMESIHRKRSIPEYTLETNILIKSNENLDNFLYIDENYYYKFVKKQKKSRSDRNIYNFPYNESPFFIIS